MTNEEKTRYVRSHMKMSLFGRTAKAILASIPESLVNSLTAEQLVVIADALHAAHEAGKAKAEAEILAEAWTHVGNRGAQSLAIRDCLCHCSDLS
jgi:hypothetical protein